VCARCDLRRDFGEMEVHRLGVTPWHEERRALAVLRTDRAEDVGRGGPLVFRSARAGAAFGPAPRDFILLAEARLVREPDLYAGWIDAFFPRDLLQACGGAFLKSSIAPAACA
jgi:hypothetical protein